MAAGLPTFKTLPSLFVFLLTTLLFVVPTFAQDEVEDPAVDDTPFDQGELIEEDIQTESETFTPSGVINVIRNTIHSETQTDSASIDNVLIPIVESAIEEGVPPGNVVSLIKHLDKLGLSPDEMAAAVARLNELIASGMSPGQALNQVKAEANSNEDEDTEADETSTNSETVSSSNGNGNNGNGGAPPGDKGSGNNNGKGKAKGKNKK